MCLRLRIIISPCVYFISRYFEHYAYPDLGLQSILNLKSDTTAVTSGSEEMYTCVKRTSLEADCRSLTANPGESRE